MHRKRKKILFPYHVLVCDKKEMSFKVDFLIDSKTNIVEKNTINPKKLLNRFFYIINYKTDF